MTMEPRCLSREEAARYAGCKSLSAFSDRIRRGLLPAAMPGTRTWDKRAIDAALDRQSGFQPNAAPDPFDEWKAQRARKSQGRASGQEAAG